ncbi:hypothetical protein L9F63_023779, partial [Diploptera punctata]
KNYGVNRKFFRQVITEKNEFKIEFFKSTPAAILIAADAIMTSKVIICNVWLIFTHSIDESVQCHAYEKRFRAKCNASVNEFANPE